jgi:triosephosphate isomerase
MRKPVIAGNWKMYKLLSEAVDTALALKPLVANANHCEVVIAPVFTALKTVADRLEGSNIKVADAQGCRLLARDHRPLGASPVLRRD